MPATILEIYMGELHPINKFGSRSRSALETNSSCRHFTFPEVLWPFIF